MTKHRGKRHGLRNLLIAIAMLAVLPGWAEGSDSNSVTGNTFPTTLYIAQTGAGVVEVPSGWPSTVCGNGGHNPGDVGWPGTLASPPQTFTYPYVWLFGPDSATYQSDPNWAYIWGQQQAYGAWLERIGGVWGPNMAGGTLFADVETGFNVMCGTGYGSSGWRLDGSADSQQQNTNVIQGFLAEAQALTGNPGGLYWNPTAYNQITSNGIWPYQLNYYVYWQAGGCAITSYCHFITTSSLSSAQSQYVTYRCSENINANFDDLMVIWQYYPSMSFDLDLSAQHTWELSGNWFRPGANGC